VKYGALNATFDFGKNNEIKSNFLNIFSRRKNYKQNIEYKTN
jgi:hypothetical protein